MRLGMLVNRLLKHLVAQPTVCNLHGLAHKGHQQGIGLDDERLEELVLLEAAAGGARRADGGESSVRGRAGVVQCAGADGELAPARDPRGAVGADADALADALEVGRVGDLLAQPWGEGDELEDLVAGDGAGRVGAEERVAGGVGDCGRLLEAGEGTQVADDGLDGLQVGHDDGRG